MSDDKKPDVAVPPTQVKVKRKYRSFSTDQKLAILAEFHAAPSSDERNAVLRKHGIYSSILYSWKKSLALKSQSKASARSQLEALQKENARLNLELARSKALLDLQKNETVVRLQRVEGACALLVEREPTVVATDRLAFA